MFNFLTTMSKNSHVSRIVTSSRMVVTDICISEERVMCVSVTRTCVEILGSEATVCTVFQNVRKNLRIGATLCPRTLEYSLYISSQISKPGSKNGDAISLNVWKSISRHYLYLITSNRENTATFIIAIPTSVQLSSCLKNQLVFCFHMVHKNYVLSFLSFPHCFPALANFLL